MKQKKIDDLFKTFEGKYKKIVILEGNAIKAYPVGHDTDSPNILNSVVGYKFTDSEGKEYKREDFEPIAYYQKDKFMLGNNKCWAGIL